MSCSASSSGATRRRARWRLITALVAALAHPRASATLPRNLALIAGGQLLRGTNRPAPADAPPPLAEAERGPVELSEPPTDSAPVHGERSGLESLPRTAPTDTGPPPRAAWSDDRRLPDPRPDSAPPAQFPTMSLLAVASATAPRPSCTARLAASRAGSSALPRAVWPARRGDVGAPLPPAPAPDDAAAAAPAPEAASSFSLIRRAPSSAWSSASASCSSSCARWTAASERESDAAASLSSSSARAASRRSSAAAAAAAAFFSAEAASSTAGTRCPCSVLTSRLTSAENTGGTAASIAALKSLLVMSPAPLSETASGSSSPSSASLLSAAPAPAPAPAPAADASAAAVDAPAPAPLAPVCESLRAASTSGAPSSTSRRLDASSAAVSAARSARLAGPSVSRSSCRVPTPPAPGIPAPDMTLVPARRDARRRDRAASLAVD
mmetsp:Transcript_3439/g.14161  ORF Transcript_3439/g.14161 Transcript_3439/m.14161 type:complete len:440 (-) Transcript_3439:39-1358(-)